MKQEITYVAKCGCRLNVTATIRKKGYSRVCRVHREPILRAERECIDCDAIIHLKHTGKGPFRCEEHRIEHNIKKRHEVYIKASLKKKDYVPTVVKKPPQKWSFDPRGDYCMWLRSCLGSGKLSCDICRKFVGVFMGHDPQSLEQFTL